MASHPILSLSRVDSCPIMVCYWANVHIQRLNDRTIAGVSSSYTIAGGGPFWEADERTGWLSEMFGGKAQLKTH